VHDKTVMDDYLRAMEQIEGVQTAMQPVAVPENAFALLDKLGQEELNDEQRQLVAELRRCLTQQDNAEMNTKIVNEQAAQLALVEMRPS